jgi:outer membrane protein assembly factor BamD
MRFARDQLAGKEMQVGRYYLERKEYIAAASRFRVVVEKYPMTNQIEEALARLVETYYAMGVDTEAQTAAAVLGHNYPDSQWYSDSYKLLQSKGLEPRENSGSWISRAGKKLLGV